MGLKKNQTTFQRGGASTGASAFPHGRGEHTTVTYTPPQLKGKTRSFSPLSFKPKFLSEFLFDTENNFGLVFSQFILHLRIYLWVCRHTCLSNKTRTPQNSCINCASLWISTQMKHGETKELYKCIYFPLTFKLNEKLRVKVGTALTKGQVFPHRNLKYFEWGWG